jgi:hypothetical protein
MKAANRIFAQLRGLRPWRAWCVALAIILLTSTAMAAQPLTGTFRGRSVGRFVRFQPPNQGFVRDWSGVLLLQLDQSTPGDGLGPLVPVFCIEVNVLVRQGDRYISDGPVTALHGGCQIRYLLDRYPASTATTADEAAARQLAIWHFSDDVDLTTVQEASVRARAIVLANEAAAAVALGACPGTQTSIANLTLEPPVANVVVGQAVNYTVRVDPASAAQSVDLQVSGTATFGNGLQQITLPLSQGVAIFSVLNPVAGTSTVTARLPYMLDAGTVFSPIDAGSPTQRLVLGERVTLTASATVQAVWGPPTDTPTVAPTTQPSATSTPISTPAVPTATPNTTAPTATPTVGAPQPTSTATQTVVTPNPTSRPPSKPKSTPAPAPEGTVTPTTGAGTPGGPPGNDLPGQPGEGTPGAQPGESITPGAEAPGGAPALTPQVGAGGEAAGGAGEVLPSQLPNTGGPARGRLLLPIAGLLLAVGVLLRAKQR